MVKRPTVPALRFFDPYRETDTPAPLIEEERQILRTVNQQIAAKRSLNDVIDFLFESTGSVLPFDRLGLAFVQDDGRRVISQYARTTYEPVLLGKGYAEDLRGSSLDQVLKAGTPRIIDDLPLYLVDHPNSRSTKLLIDEGVRSSLTCPLLVEGRVVGFLFRSSRQAHVYRAHHVELEMTVSERLSQAVEKAWRIEQLQEANFAYMEMLGFVSHELKNPIASIVTDAQLLTHGYLGDLTDKQREKIERMVTRGKYLLDLIREYLELAHVEQGELQLNVHTGIDFNEIVIEPAIEIIRPQLEAQSMTLEVVLPEEPLLADCDPGLLRIVLVNLLGNAVKYGNPGGRVRLSAKSKRNRFTATVWNEGPGIPPSERNKLFRRFSRLQTPELLKRKGTGVGLYSAWRIIQMHRGRIRADSQLGEWAAFTLDIPQPLSQNGAKGTTNGSSQ